MSLRRLSRQCRRPLHPAVGILRTRAVAPRRSQRDEPGDEEDPAEQQAGLVTLHEVRHDYFFVPTTSSWS